MSGAVSWEEGGKLRAESLVLARPVVIGRGDASDIQLTDASVSREHAVIEFRVGRYLVTNRSRTNPTLLNGNAAADGAPLNDGDLLVLGTVPVRFHDLSSGDGISGPMCSHCGRENKSTDKDCWYCGTSLVYAASTLRTRRQVVGRVVAASGEFLDLYAGQSARLGEGMPSLIQAPGQNEPALAGWAEVSAAQDGLLLSAGDGAQGRALSTGDTVDAGGARYVVIIR